MTRSHKFNDKDHAGIAEGAAPETHLPHYFAKNGFVGADPKKTKKNGGGKGNWGHTGDEILDEDDFHFANARRRSNSTGYANGLKDFKTKFDVNEQEPVFEESVHGPGEEDEEPLTKADSTSSSGSEKA